MPTCPDSAPLTAQVSELSARLRAALPGAQAAVALVVAGSGLGGFARGVAVEASVSYADLPHVGASTVAGHAGNLASGTIASGGDEAPTPVLVMNGRRHLYEGIEADNATLLLRAILSAFPQLRAVILSNAAGGLNRAFSVGDLMILSDHVNWTFRNPLLGPNVEAWGPRFPDLSNVYDGKLRAMAREAAAEAGVPAREGVYIAGHGPTYETRAEVNMMRNMLGGDAVGMSTAPEALVCAHAGVPCLGISFISNIIAEPGVTTHDEVMENSRLVEGRFAALVSGVVRRVAAAR